MAAFDWKSACPSFGTSAAKKLGRLKPDSAAPSTSYRARSLGRPPCLCRREDGLRGRESICLFTFCPRNLIGVLDKYDRQPPLFLPEREKRIELRVGVAFIRPLSSQSEGDTHPSCVGLRARRCVDEEEGRFALGGRLGKLEMLRLWLLAPAACLIPRDDVCHGAATVSRFVFLPCSVARSSLCAR